MIISRGVLSRLCFAVGLFGGTACGLVKAPKQTGPVPCGGECSGSVEHRTGTMDGCDAGVAASDWEAAQAKGRADESCRSRCENPSCTCASGKTTTRVLSQRESEPTWGPSRCERTLEITYTGRCGELPAAVPTLPPSAAPRVPDGGPPAPADGGVRAVSRKVLSTAPSAAPASAR